MNSAPTQILSLAQAVTEYAGVSGCYGIFHRNFPKRPYIGESTDVGERFAKHLYELRTGRHHCYGLERFFYFAREEHFTTELLKECSPNRLRAVERHFLRLYPDAVNSQMSQELRGAGPVRKLSPAKIRRAAHVAKMAAISGVSPETQFAAECTQIASEP